ncbi:MAG: imelysin family protein [Cyanobacteria bacterium P01_A01_bin.135]
MALACSSAAGAIAQSSPSAQANPDVATQGGVVARDGLPPSQAAAMQTLNQRFAATVVIPTYVSLTEQTQRLAEASRQFVAEPTEESLAALRGRWVDATSAWAKGQAFAFGPVHSLGYSTALEFPADSASIEVLLSDPAVLEADNIDAIVEAIALSPSVHGFEAIAYVLYGLDGDKALGDFSAVQRLYIARLAEMADEKADELLQVWQEGWEDSAPYETVLATAGQPNNGAYLSVEAGTEEIIRGLYNHLDVVVNEALPEMMEAWETDSILPDTVALTHLHSSVSGVQLAYTGVTDEVTSDTASETASGLDQLVAMENRVIDQVIQRFLATALTSLETAIANPEDGDALANAYESLATVHEYLETDVLALVQSPQP